MIEKYLRIISHFGINTQLDKLTEETNEFIDAVKEMRIITFNSEGDLGDKEAMDKAREHLIEEMGDILTILSQFVFYYEIEKPELDKFMDEKLERTLKRIEEGYYEKERE